MRLYYIAERLQCDKLGYNIACSSIIHACYQRRTFVKLTKIALGQMYVYLPNRVKLSLPLYFVRSTLLKIALIMQQFFMFEASVVVDLSTLEQSGSLISGTIYLQIGQYAFPEKGWYDNPALILSWWLGNIVNGKHKFLFMEGSFSFKESKSDIQLMYNGKVQASYPIVWQELHKSIGRTAEQVIQYLEADGNSHSNLNELKDKHSLRKNW